MHFRAKNILSSITLGGSALLTLACVTPTADPDCAQTCDVFGKLPGVGECREGQCTPTFSECFDRMEFGTCSNVCESLGTVCAENACADATYLVHGNIENCMDPSKEGVLQAHACDEPIDWQFASAAQCCCEQP